METVETTEVAEPVVPVVEEPEPASSGTTAPAPAPAPAPAVPAFTSLYGDVWTTFLAVMMGILIVAGIQMTVLRIFAREKNEHRALTQFVTAMVAIMVGVYVSDMLIAGPNAELLSESERVAILSFVKDTALMIFAYYFGTKSAGKDAEVPTPEHLPGEV